MQRGTVGKVGHLKEEMEVGLRIVTEMWVFSSEMQALCTGLVVE